MTVRDLIVLGSSSQQPTRMRNHSALLLRWNGEGFLFDPGEGTQRQFIFADVAPPTVTRIFVTHFHGDHCLGLGSMLMRLNLDKVKHPIHCYYPASGKVYFDRLRFGTICHETINVVEHPIYEDGIVDTINGFTVEAYFLNHGVDCVGYRITEADTVRFDKQKLIEHSVKGPLVKQIEREGSVQVDGKTVTLEEVSNRRNGDTFSLVLDTKFTEKAITVAQDAKLFVCESTYLDSEKKLAEKYMHMTAKQAAEIARRARVGTLVLTHYSARYRDVDLFEAEAREIFPNAHAGDDFRRFEFPR